MTATASEPVIKKKKKRQVVDFNDFDTHWHRCSNTECGAVWAHTPPADDLDDEKDVEMHTCLLCKTVTRAQARIVPIREGNTFLAASRVRIKGSVRFTSSGGW